MKNLLFENVEYKTDTTPLGTWRRFVYPTGQIFEEFTSHKQYFGFPLVHFTRGKCPETGKRIIARGIIAIGRLAIGGLALGHASAGIIAVGQLSIGVLLGLGQLSTGVLALGQIAIALYFGVGQAACGYAVIAQFGIGTFVLAQKGFGAHVCDMSGCSEAVTEFFREIIPFMKSRHW
jgi:hypothetical protein